MIVLKIPDFTFTKLYIFIFSSKLLLTSHHSRLTLQPCSYGIRSPIFNELLPYFFRPEKRYRI